MGRFGKRISCLMGAEVRLYCFKNTATGLAPGLAQREHRLTDKILTAGLQRWLHSTEHFAEDPSSVPSTYTGRLIDAFISSSRKSDTLFWLPWALYAYIYMYIYI